MSTLVTHRSQNIQVTGYLGERSRHLVELGDELAEACSFARDPEDKVTADQFDEPAEAAQVSAEASRAATIAYKGRTTFRVRGYFIVKTASSGHAPP